MRRDQLEHAIRTACQIIERPEVIVVGSQAILGSFRENELPADATMSVEVDILPIADSNDETARLADLIEGVAGEFSTFEELHGFSIDGVDLETSVARSVGESAERQHGGAGRTATVHRLVPGQGRSLCRQALRVQGEGSQLRCSPAGGRTRRCGRDPRAASQRRGKTPARCRPCCGVVGVMERRGLTLGVLRRACRSSRLRSPRFTGHFADGSCGARRTRWAS
jgi:hypothetical protein